MSNSDKIIELSKYESFMEEPKKFEESIYSSTYKKTKSLVKKLLDESEYIEEEKLRRKIGALDKKEINNMIAFVGKRGTGKTTAMFSFLNYLNTYGNSVYEEPFREIDFGSVKFHCLDFIDGGLLEKEENILHILVANMYRKFMETSEERFHDDWREYDIRELQELFIRVENSLRQINDKNKWGQSSIENLKNVSNSLGLKRDLEQLIKRYLSLMKNEKNQYIEHSQKQVLVIAIDDLDMNLDHGFDTLEAIHRYLMMKDVIVFISVDYEQLLNLSKVHFGKIYKDLGERDSNIRDQISDMSQLYLEKVIPLYKRVYTGALNFEGNQNIKVKNLDKKLKIKNYVFEKIYQKTGILFDLNGKKTHFYEPENIRKLKYMNMFFDYLGDETIEGYPEENYNEMLNDFSQRFVGDKLEYEEKKEMQKIMNSNLHRGVEELFDYLIRCISQKDGQEIEDLLRYKKERTQTLNLMYKLEEQKYDYGTLLHLIYIYGRLGDKEKRMVHCILAYYTIRLSKIYYSKESDSIRNKELIDFCAGSISGNLTNYMLPNVVYATTLKNSDKDINYRKSKMSGYIELSGTGEDWVQLNIEISPDDKENTILEFIRNIEICLLFFTTKDRENSKLEISIIDIGETQLGETKKFAINLEIRSNDKLYFCPWGFVVNSIQYLDILGKIEKDIKERMDGIDCDKLLLKDYEQWDKQYGNFALPIWDFDLMYNVEKRLIKEENEVIGIENIQELIGKISHIYEKCEDILNKQDESMEGKTNLGEIFRNCPAVKYFGENNFTAVFGTIWMHAINRETDLSKGIINFYEEEIQER